MSTPPTNTHKHTNTHTCTDKCAKYKETWIYEVRTHICLVMTYHVLKALPFCITTHTNKQTHTHTHIYMLTHLHLHERPPVEAACCSRQGTPQTTPLRHGGHTPSSATFPQTFPLAPFSFSLYFTSLSSLLSSSYSVPHPGCPI